MGQLGTCVSAAGHARSCRHRGRPVAATHPSAQFVNTVPDAPVSKVVIELKGGKKHGLLVNSANICKAENRAIVKIAGQNGKTADSQPKIAVECGKKNSRSK